MHVNVLFFGILAEKAGVSSLTINNTTTLHELIGLLEKKFPLIAQKNTKYIVARNHEIVRENITLDEKDEIALLPPFSGG